MNRTQVPAGTSAHDSSRPLVPATVAAVMQPMLTTVEPRAHLAGAAYLMKHVGSSALLVVDERTQQPAGIITGTDILHAAACGMNVNEVRVEHVMAADPAVVDAATSISDAAAIMKDGRHRHLAVADDLGLIGIVDITAVLRALLDGQDALPRPRKPLPDASPHGEAEPGIAWRAVFSRSAVKPNSDETEQNGASIRGERGHKISASSGGR